MPDRAGADSTALVWFRRDLRLSENPAWAEATNLARSVVPLFVLDDALVARAGRRRVAQLFGSLRALDRKLGAAGGRLHVVRGRPDVMVPEVVRRFGVRTVFANADVSPYADARDGRVERAAGVEFRWSSGTLVHPPGSVVTRQGRVHRVFTPFWRQWESRPLPSVTATGRGTPTAEVGVPIPAAPEPVLAPGEDAARGRLRAFLDGRLADYPERHDSLGVLGSSGLSIDLKFGTLSPTEVATAAGDTVAGRSLRRQVAWRDWFAHLVADQPDLIWRDQRRSLVDLAWRDDPDGLAAWQAGRTGFPVVDAGMRELEATGSMHNRARMITASFLVKDLLIDWRVGAEHFREHLVDYDPAQNSGNWQWVAGTGHDAAPFHRVFNPVIQGARFDPQGTYVRRWVPELARLDVPAIHAPWECQDAELAAAGVVLGRHYPLPVVDHGVARRRALAAFQEARTR